MYHPIVGKLVGWYMWLATVLHHRGQFVAHWLRFDFNAKNAKS
jgi:hypothetical protein